MRGLVRARVLDEADEIATPTLKSITLATLLKTMGWHEERRGMTAENAGPAQDAAPPG